MRAAALDAEAVAGIVAATVMALQKAQGAPAALPALSLVPPPPAAAPVTCDHLWSAYWKAERDRLRKSVTTLGRWQNLQPFFGARIFAELKRTDVAAYRLERAKDRTNRGRAPQIASVNREVATLRRMGNWALDAGLLISNPLARLRMEHEDNVRSAYLSPEAQRAIVAHAPPIVRELLIVLGASGMRIGEALGLTWERLPDGSAGHVDLAAGVVHLPGSATKNGRGRSPRLTAEAVEALEGLKRTATTPYVFGNPETGRPFNYSHVRNKFRVALALAGIGPDQHGDVPTIHTYRHSFVTNCRRRGLPDKVTRALSGHRSDGAFARYGAVLESEVDAAWSTVNGTDGSKP